VNSARFTAGAIPAVEATRSNVAMLQFRSNVVRADLDVASAAAKLRVLLGRAAGDPIEIDEPTAAEQITAPLEPAALEALAFQARPDLVSLQLTQARSIADLRLQEAMGRVDYTVGAEYRRQQGIAGRSNSLGVFFSTPLPVSNRNQGEIARATAERGQIERQIAARKAQVVADVRGALHEYETTRDLFASIEHDLLSPATRARDVTLYTYKAGGATLLDVLDAERAFNDTMQSYLDAQSSVRRATARLNAAVGSEVVK
jgi:cobalt-zinc-cadmium efflux system outer membrane protein